MNVITASQVAAGTVSLLVSCTALSCPETNGLVGTVEISGFKAEIRDDAPPTVTSVRGSLAATGVHRGMETVTFDATDDGVGIFRSVAEIRLNGTGPWVQLGSAPASYVPECTPLRETTYLYEFDHAAPCSTEVRGSQLTVEPGTLPSGTHQIQVFVEDAAGNRTLILSPRDYVVPGVTAPVTSDVAPVVIAPIVAAPGVPGPPQLRITAPRNRLLPSSAPFDLAGRLLDADSNPIPGALVRIQARALLPKAGLAQGAWGEIGQAVTDSDGVFRGRIPGGASRSLLISYTAPVDGGPAAATQFDVTVPAQVTVKAQRTRVRNGQAVKLTGKVAGPIPEGGVLVAMEVREPGRWIPVATTRRWVRTKPNGTFTLSYRFRNTYRAATYRFRVVADEDSAFQYGRGASRSIDIRVRP